MYLCTLHSENLFQKILFLVTTDLLFNVKNVSRYTLSLNLNLNLNESRVKIQLNLLPIYLIISKFYFSQLSRKLFLKNM